jgi:glycosyltransferase involved in cell wall biosynthesis
VEGFFDALQKHPDLFLLLVGPQNKGENPSLDEDFVVNLKRQIVDKGANERVQFKGLIKDRETLAELYHTADGFVFPSRREGLPNVVLEAMTSGLPVIASDLPGLKPVITHGQNGFIVPIGDIDSLIQAIIDLVENPEGAAQLGKNARNHILTHHSFSTWQTYLVKIYQNLFQEKL